MLDRFAVRLIRPTLHVAAKALVKLGVGANSVTVVGFLIGIFAAVLIATQAYLAGAIAILLSRLSDGIDGAVARQTQATDAGGFLDITLDFLFYASIPLAFALANPAANALAAATLLMAFMGTSSSFLAFAALAAKRGLHSVDYPDKSFFFLGGLTEATETLATFMAMCLWPQHFALLAYTFAALCAVTTATRIWWGWKSFS
ncbi:CDP-alcohol phosphatidyltransferase family protein [Rhodoferax aquaticus]|uniref:CDP-alcohol phosphatidyltransferase family protein n=1 Tax=Rhodoferax aquaticus TaxID=2527691 RepID=A0A515ESU1_9BURK|nr:CDP-alcohol phosphatidyltransferase family protein [Rhodoferax aquaticus]QDL55725.1 CDP-alcohol phosphatidyltransferase family protein [Rhodoferax aquaticus]